MSNCRVCHFRSPVKVLLWTSLIVWYVFAGTTSANEYKEYKGSEIEETTSDGGTSFFSAVTEDFLSNTSRVGSLVGSLLGGAAYAHPLSPIAGSVIGFFVGKASDFSDDEESEQERFARRSFAPSGESFDQPQLAMEDTSAGGSLSFQDSPEPPESAIGGPLPLSSQRLELERATGGASGPASSVSGAPSGRQESVNLVITKHVGNEQEKLDELAETIRREQNRSEFVPSERCPERNAPGYRKKLAVAGFSVEYPKQTVFGDLGEAGQSVSKMLYQDFQQSGKVLPFVAPNWQMFASLDSAPTYRGFTNRLSKYSAVSREMGTQFVVSGVIRSIAVRDPGAWDTSTLSKTKRTLLGADTMRSFVVDVVVHDGYTGQVLLEKRFETAGAWEADRYDKVGFGTARFAETGYGQAVEDLLEEISEEVSGRVACQPMLVPILEVNGQDMVLDVGTDSGLLPGDALKVVRAQSSWADLKAPPRLIDTGVEVRVHSLSLDSAQAFMPEHGGMINIQQGDYAVIY